MAQPGDFRFQNEQWSQLKTDGTWVTFPSNVQSWLKAKYSGVSGEGPTQSFGMVGVDGVTSRDAVIQGMNSEKGRENFAPSSVTNQPGAAGPQGGYGDRMTAWFREFVGAAVDDKTVKYPPEKYDEYDADMMREFINWGEERELFTSDDVAAGTAGVFIDPTTKRTFIRQPDGKIVYVPDKKPEAAAPATPEIETHGGIQFINQDGKLTPIDNVMKKMKENFVVTGKFKEAAAVHAWETRPSNQEYFDRMLQYVNAPADQLLISAIARGQGLVSPPPEETIQRIGPQPEYLTEAFNMMREQMQMGQPGEEETFESIMQKNAADLAQRKGEQELQESKQDSEDRHNAAVIANEFQSSINQMDVNDRIEAKYNLAQDEGGEPGDFSFPDALAGDQGAVDTDGDMEGAYSGGISAFSQVGANLADRGDRGLSWRDSQGNIMDPDTAAQNVEAFWKNLNDEQKAFVNQWPGGIWSFAGSAENIGQMESVLNTHFQNAPETVGKILPQADQSATELTQKGKDQILALGGELPEVLGQPTYEADPTVVKSEEDVLPIAADTAAFDAATDKYGKEFLTSGGNVTDVGTAGFVPDPTTSMPIDLGNGQRVRPIVPTPTTVPVGVGAPVPKDPDDYAGRYYDEGANGIRTGANPTLVGESGPELALFPNGTEIVPLDRRMKPDQAMRLRNRGVRGMAEGGIVFEDPRDNPLPLGIRQLQAGRSLGAPRGQLLRTAGIALPSAQARRRMLPGEREAFQGLGRMAGIPVGEFQQELGITTPSGAPRVGSARMLPLSLRR